MLRWQEIVELGVPEQTVPSWVPQKGGDELASTLFGRLTQLQNGYTTWANAKVSSVEVLDDTLAQQVADLQALYLALSEAYQRIKHGSGEMLGEERASLTEAIKEVEVLVARLDYEIGALVGKVHDVEENVATFESQVEEVERRADELKSILETESWLHWFVRTLTGIGTGPNITRGHEGPREAAEPKR